MRYAYLTCFALLSLIGTLQAAEMRTWTSRDGKFEIRAELVAIDEHGVRLKKSDGKVKPVPLSKLSAADRQFVKEYKAKIAKEPKAKKISPAKKSSKSPTTRIDPQLSRAFEAKGYKITKKGVSLRDETKLGKEFRASKQDQRILLQAARELSILQQHELDIKRQIAGLIHKDFILNRELANIGRTQVNKNNRLVGAISANRSQIELMRQKAKRIAEQLRAVRASANDAREKYIGRLLEMRKLVESIQDRYQGAAADDQLQEMLARLIDVTGKYYQLAESSSFLSNVKRLKKLEDSVLSESIPLRRAGGGTLYVSVVLDGKYSQEMVLDSGASMISLPPEVAEKCGIEVKPSDPKVILELADGRRITGRLVVIPSVRVGKFTVENVEAAVLGPEATSAEPLLGMTFLGNFKFEVDANKSTLTMVKVEMSAAR